MTSVVSRTLPFSLWLLWLSVLGGGWANASRAAEVPLPLVQDTLADHEAGRMRAIETPLAQDASFGVPLQKAVPAEPTGTDEQESRALAAVSPVVPVGTTPDALAGALEPVNPLGSTAGRPDVQSLNPASAQHPSHPQR